MTGLTASRAYGILALRVVTGFYFLWAGLDKVFSFVGGTEPFSAAGFLTFGTAGTTSVAVAEGTIVNPAQGFWVDLAANRSLLSVVNILVPYGQIAIGLALILGVATRFAGVMGFLMTAFITIAAWDFAHGRRDPLTNVTDDDPLLTAKIALAHLRELPDYYTRLALMEAAGEGRPLRVRDLMTLEPRTVRDNTPLVRAERLMRESGVSGLPVVDGEGRLVGVLSRTDLMRVAGGSGNEAWQGISVASTMTAPGLTVDADAPLAEAAARMEEQRVHRLVVVEPEGGHPIGILSTTDLVRSIAGG